MSWTTVCDLPMVAYQGNRTFDATSFANDADLLGSVTSHQEFVSFQGDDGQIEVVVRNDSLARFAGLRVQALVRPQTITRRYNIAEGWMSFALVIEADGRLRGTIYDGHNWVGPDSGTVKVPANRWSRVSFEFDGVSIATLTIEGASVGSKLDMPVGMRQPQQVITLGHWPRGDGRYTMKGEIGHVRIDRRDFEDVFADAVDTAFCRRGLTAAQVEARRELAYLFESLEPPEQQRVRDCAKAQYEAMAQLIHDLRGLGGRETVRLRRLGESLRAAWCCAFDVGAAREALKSYLAALAEDPGTKELIGKFIEGFFEISHMCERGGYPYDRMAELNRGIFPEFVRFEADVRQLLGEL